ncbi:MAG: Uma2 family endonuclease [Thermomicrobiales bacterium]|nr:Uma2 family endonuclease [Thermomicrobiales bacterium]
MPSQLEQPRALTWEDLLAFPEDNQKREIIRGELIVSPGPSVWHQEVVLAIYRRLYAFAHARQAGKVMTSPIDVRFSSYDVTQPDVLFIRADRFRSLLTSDARIAGAPDLVVEVISPTSRSIDCVRKFALYADAGVPEYWLVDPEMRSLQIFTLEGDRYTQLPAGAAGRVASRVLPGLIVDPGWVFVDLESSS